jgi:hypothetical protein
MLNLQLGIRYTLTTLSKVPRPQQIQDSHFQEKVGDWLGGKAVLRVRSVGAGLGSPLGWTGLACTAPRRQLACGPGNVCPGSIREA